MARSRGMVTTAIWVDRDFVETSPAAKLVYLMLLSQPDVNQLGVLSLATSRWAACLNAPEPMVRDALAELELARFVVVDEPVQQILVRSFMRNDGVWRQPNVMRAALAALPIVVSSKIAGALLDEIARIEAEELHETVAETLSAMKEQLKTLGEPYAKGSANPTRSLPEGFAKALGDRGEGLGTELTVRARAREVPAQRRGTRVPEPFPVTPEMVAWWKERCPQVDPRHETEKFVNYWRAKSGQGATKLDWTATWRNWMLSAAERLPAPASNGDTPRSTGQARAEQAAEAGRRLQERMENGG
jgi:hypothetical protein